MIILLRDVLEAFQIGETDQERGTRIAAAFHDEPENLLAECDEHIAYAGNNYLPFMLAPYQTQRPLLLNCLSLLNLESTSADLSLIAALRFVLANRQSHREWISVADANINLKWIPEKWRRLITGQRSGPVTEVSRKYFELCGFTGAMQELQSGDLYVANSDQYSDYRVQLIDWESYQAQVAEYGAMLGLQTEPKAFSSGLKKWLADRPVASMRGSPKTSMWT